MRFNTEIFGVMLNDTRNGQTASLKLYQFSENKGNSKFFTFIFFISIKAISQSQLIGNCYNLLVAIKTLEEDIHVGCRSQKKK